MKEYFSFVAYKIFKTSNTQAADKADQINSWSSVYFDKGQEILINNYGSDYRYLDQYSEYQYIERTADLPLDEQKMKKIEKEAIPSYFC